MTDQIRTLQQWIGESRAIVFFGGAGVSTESGIPDFRSVDGLYSQKFAWPPEEILSHSFFFSHTAEFYRFYREKMLPLEAQPNRAHRVLASGARCRISYPQGRAGGRLGTTEDGPSWFPGFLALRAHWASSAPGTGSVTGQRALGAGESPRRVYFLSDPTGALPSWPDPEARPTAVTTVALTAWDQHG